MMSMAVLRFICLLSVVYVLTCDRISSQKTNPAYMHKHLHYKKLTTTRATSTMTSRKDEKQRHEDAICQADCNNLYAGYAFKHIPYKKKLHFTMAKKFVNPLKLVFLKSVCPIDCTGGLTTCEHTKGIKSNYNGVESAEFDMEDVPKYVCIRVIVENCNCHISTENKKFEEMKPIGNKYLYTDYKFIISYLLFFLTCMGIFLIYCYMSPGPESPSDRGFEEELSEVFSDSAIPDEIRITPEPDILRHAILIIYYRGSEEYIAVIEILKNLLTSYGFVVHDPFDPEIMNDVFTDMENWVERKLLTPRLKVVVVETKEAIDRMKNSAQPGFYGFNHDERSLDMLFVYAINRLQDSFRVFNNNNNLFVVRFNHCPEIFEYMVPNMRYCIPDHLSTLFRNIESPLFGTKTERMLGLELEIDFAIAKFRSASAKPTTGKKHWWKRDNCVPALED